MSETDGKNTDQYAQWQSAAEKQLKGKPIDLPVHRQNENGAGAVDHVPGRHHFGTRLQDVCVGGCCAFIGQATEDAKNGPDGRVHIDVG